MSKKKAIFLILFFSAIAFVAGMFAEVYFYNMKLESTNRAIPGRESHPLNENTLFSLVQEWRTENNLPEYNLNQQVCGFAESRLNKQLINFSHDGFQEDIDAFSKLNGGNPDWIFGENLVQWAISDEDALLGWIESPKHLANLKADYTDSCIKCKYTYCTQIFLKKSD